MADEQRITTKFPDGSVADVPLSRMKEAMGQDKGVPSAWMSFPDGSRAAVRLSDVERAMHEDRGKLDDEEGYSRAQMFAAPVHSTAAESTGTITADRTSPSIWDRLGNLVTSTKRSFQQNDPRLALESLLSFGEQERHPMATGATRTLSGFTTPQSVAMMAAASPLAVGAPMLSRAAGIGLGAIGGIQGVRDILAAHEAAKQGDMQRRGQLYGSAGANLGMAGLGTLASLYHLPTGAPGEVPAEASGGAAAVTPRALSTAQPHAQVFGSNAEMLAGLSKAVGAEHPAFNPDAASHITPEQNIQNGHVSPEHVEAMGDLTDEFGRLQEKVNDPLASAQAKAEARAQMAENRKSHELLSTTITQAASGVAEAKARQAANIEAMRPMGVAERIQNVGDVNRVLDQAKTQGTVTGLTDARANEPLTFEHMRGLADSVGLSVEDLTKPGRAFSAEEVIAANRMLGESAARVVNLARVAAREGEGQEAANEALLEQIARHNEIREGVRGRVLREAGRSLVAAKAGAQDMVTRAADALGQLLQDAQAEAAKRLALLDPTNVGAISRFIKEITPSTTGDKLYEAWLNGLLSGGSSQIAKVTGDVTMRALAPLQRLLAGGIDFASSALTGKPRARWAGEIGSDVWGAIAGLPEAVRRFSSTLREEMEPGNEFAAHQIAIKGAKGRLVRLPSQSLAAVTDFFNALNHSAELHSQAYEMASREGLSPVKNAGAFVGRVQELVANPTAEMTKRAGAYANRQTFQESVGDLSKIARNSVAKWFVPFVKTPLNIGREAYRLSPAGLVNAGGKIILGKMDSGEAADALARSLMGTGAFVWAMQHAMAGNITGAKPHTMLPTSIGKRVNAGDVLLQHGWQPYSIKLDGKYYSFHRAEPIGMMLGAAADFAHGLQTGASEDELGKVLSAGLSAVWNQAKDMPFLSTLSRLSNALDREQDMAGRIESMGRQQAGTVIPQSVANLARGLDKTPRDYPQNLGEEFESRIPGLRGRLPVATRPQNPVGPLGGAIPFPVTRPDRMAEPIRQMTVAEDRAANAKAAQRARRRR